MKERRKKRPVDRFEAMLHVDRVSGCWLWTGALSHGYGVFGIAYRTVRAHRAAWVLYRGSIPPGMSVLHRCDVRRCVNPEHLFLGTQADNMRDMVKKGRQKKPQKPPTARPGRATGERHHKAKLTVVQVFDIWHRFRAGEMIKDLAEEYGVSPGAVGGITRGLAWRHLGLGDARV